MMKSFNSQVPTGELYIIQELLDNGKNKEALAKCEKQLKRDKNNVTFLASKAACLFGLSRYEETRELCVRLCEQTPPITDVEIIRLVHGYYLDATHILGEQATPEVSLKFTNLWLGAGRNGGDRAINAWIRHTLRRTLVGDFQKATLLLAKEHANRDEYHFWSIVGWFMAGEALRHGQASDGATFSKLACAYLEKAAKVSLDNKPPTVSQGKGICTSGQLRLLVQVLKENSRRKELLQILESSKLGVGSNLSMKDWFFVGVKIDVLTAENLWEDLRHFCTTLLENARLCKPKADGQLDFGMQGDDWKVWKGLLTSSASLSQSLTDRPLEVRQFINSFLERHPRSRNARLALLEVYCWGREDVAITDEDAINTRTANPPSELLNACEKHFQHYCVKYSCFEDLRPYLRKLYHWERNRFRQHVRRTAEELKLCPSATEKRKLSWLNAELNALKIDYLQKVSVTSDCNEDVIVNFIVAAVRLHNWSRQCGSDLLETDLKPGDDACNLAALALLKLSERTDQRYHTIQAALLLEGLLDYSKSSSDAKLLLLRTYLSLGLGSLAYAWYDSLELKNSQLVSLSHSIYTRVSTIHPHQIPFRKPEGSKLVRIDPYRGLKDILNIYSKDIEEKMPDMMFQALKEGSFDQVYDFFSLQASLQQDMGRKLWTLERRRIARLRGVPYDKSAIDCFGSSLGPSALAHLKTGTEEVAYYSDNRDYTTGVDFEYVRRDPLESALPKPGSHWLKTSMAYDRLCSLIVSENEVPEAHSSAKSSDGSANDFTKAEEILQSFLSTDLIAKICGLKTAKPLTTPEDCLNCIDQWLAWLSKHLCGYSENISASTGGPVESLCLASYLQTTFLALDIVKTLLNFCSIFTDKERCKAKFPNVRQVSVDRVKVTEKVIHRIYEAIMTTTKRFKQRLSECDPARLAKRVLGRRDCEASLDTGKAIEELLGASFLEIRLRGIVDGSLEALDGVLQVKLQH